MDVPPKSPFHRLLRVTENPAPLVILPHDNPDPDALASAVALRFLVNQAQEEKEIVIALGGIVGRAENRAMLRYLNIELVPVNEIDFARNPQVALVDTQPGRRNNSLPETVTATIVIDHHPAYGEYPGVPFLDLRDEYGATSTILTEYVEETHVDVESKIATALFYGINAETQDLGREATPKDVAACQFLYPYTNKRRLAKIENARVPREYFKVFRDVVTRPPSLLAKGGVARFEEVGNGIVAGHVRTRMHKTDNRFLSAFGIQETFGFSAIFCRQRHDFIGHSGRQLIKRDQTHPGSAITWNAS